MAGWDNAPSPWLAHDAQVLIAWHKRRMSDGTRIDYDAKFEQTFKVSTSGVYNVPPKETGTMFCPRGEVRDYAKPNLDAIAPDAGGHTHLNRGEQVPGAEDSLMAVRTRKPAYMLCRSHAFAIERAAEGFIIRRLDNRRFSGSEQEQLARRVASWNLNNGGSGVVCKLVPDKHF